MRVLMNSEFIIIILFKLLLKTFMQYLTYAHYIVKRLAFSNGKDMRRNESNEVCNQFLNEKLIKGLKFYVCQMKQSRELT